jgi:hypothetical protein
MGRILGRMRLPSVMVTTRITENEVNDDTILHCLRELIGNGYDGSQVSLGSLRVKVVPSCTSTKFTCYRT